jgi:hypothetical protein
MQAFCSRASNPACVWELGILSQGANPMRTVITMLAAAVLVVAAPGAHADLGLAAFVGVWGDALRGSGLTPAVDGNGDGMMGFRDCEKALDLALVGAGDARRVWVGPMPFVSDRTLRDDFYPTITDPHKWPTVLSQANVFKSYIMVLPSDPVPGKTAPELSEEQLKRLGDYARANRLKVALEVGGIRMADTTPNDQAGEYTAASELRHLKRWTAAGGSLDFLTTDHGVMMTIGAPYVDPDHFKQRGMTMADAIKELVDYFEIVHREIPTAKLGCIESLGFFTVQAPGGKVYSRTVPALPVWWFNEYLDMLVDLMTRRGLTLDHFHIDFGYEGVYHDGGGKGTLDFGRILAVEAYAQSKGVEAGVIVNAFHDRSVTNPVPAVANRQAYENTLRFFREYMAAGGKADDIVLQTWMPYPDKTGPESEPYTVLNMDRDILLDPAFPVGK